jgi:hypothetical protein
VPTGSGLYVNVTGRRVGTNAEYRSRVRLMSNGGVAVALTALRGSSTVTVLQPDVTVPGVTFTAGTRLAVRMQVTGTAPTTLRVKVWPAAGAEPAGWQLTASEATTVLQAAGSVGLNVFLSADVTNAPVVLRLSALTARPVT